MNTFEEQIRSLAAERPDVPVESAIDMIDFMEAFKRSRKEV